MEVDDTVIVVAQVDKHLMNFEAYPNDVSRGFNLWHMPVFYEIDNQQSLIYSPAMLVMTPEPDFSMPFNVNAVTHVLFGILLVNTAYVLIKHKDEE
jgi:hypothetical protein